MRKKLEIALLFLLCAAFFTPLLVPYRTYIFPFIVPKVLWFRSLAVVMLGVYAILLTTNYQRYKVKLTPITVAVLAFFVSLALSTFTSVDWYRSFWDGHERMLGLFTLVHYLAFYLVVTHTEFGRARWQWITRWFMGAASLVMLVGIQQKIDPTYLLNNGSDRVAGTLGNAIYLGGYGLFLIWLAGLAWFRETTSGGKTYAGLVGFLGVSGLLFSGTRGTLLGMIAGLIVATITVTVTAKKGAPVRKWVAVGAASVVVLAALLFSFRTTTFVRGIPAVGSLLNTSVAEGTAGTRLMSWQIAVESWRERPVFGWGINNFFYAFNEHYRPEFLQHGWGETWFDNAHNIVVNTLATQGAVGVLTYLGIFAAAAYAIITAYRAGRIDQILLVYGLGFLTAHLVQATFVFENPTSYLYFFFALAYLNQQTVGATTTKAPSDKAVGTPLLIAAALITVLVIYTTNVRVSKANTTTLKALQALYTDPKVAVTLYNQALEAGSPHVDDIRADFARVVDQIAMQYVTQAKRTDLALLVFTPAYTGLKQNIAMHPYDIRNQINLAQLAITGAKLENKSSYLLEAQVVLEDALKKSPRRQQIQYLLAGVYQQLGQNDLAVGVLEQAWNNDKKIEGSWWRLALAYNQAGQKEKAKQMFVEFDKTGLKLSAEGEQIRTLVNGK